MREIQQYGKLLEQEVFISSVKWVFSLWIQRETQLWFFCQETYILIFKGKFRDFMSNIS